MEVWAAPIRAILERKDAETAWSDIRDCCPVADAVPHIVPRRGRRISARLEEAPAGYRADVWASELLVRDGLVDVSAELLQDHGDSLAACSIPPTRLRIGFHVTLDPDRQCLYGLTGACAHLRALDLERLPPDTIRDIAPWISRATALARLSITLRLGTWNVFVPDDLVGLMLAFPPCLREFSLCQGGRVEPALFGEVFGAMCALPGLRDLAVRTPSDFEFDAGVLRRLERLKIEPTVPRFLPSAVAESLSKCTSLESLDVQGWKSANVASALHALSANLRDVKLPGASLADFRALGACGALTSLSLAKGGLVPLLLLTARNLPGLVELRVAHPNDAVSFNRLDGAWVDVNLCVRRLRVLEIGTTLDSVGGGDVDDAGAFLFVGMASGSTVLETLCTPFSPVSSAQLHFPAARTLRLGVATMRSVDDSSELAVAASRCADLRTLDLSRCDFGSIPGAIVNVLETCQELRAVVLSRCKIDDAGVARMCPALAMCANLRELDLSYNRIGGMGFASLGVALAGCPCLHELDLRCQYQHVLINAVELIRIDERLRHVNVVLARSVVA